MGDVNVGDRVRVKRVQVVEGVVEYVTTDGRNFDLRLDNHKGFSTNSSDVVTKLASPLKVGDAIEGKQAYDGLPLGSVLRGSEYNDTIVRVKGGFINVRNPDFTSELGTYFDQRTLAYLPES